MKAKITRDNATSAKGERAAATAEGNVGNKTYNDKEERRVEAALNEHIAEQDAEAEGTRKGMMGKESKGTKWTTSTKERRSTARALHLAPTRTTGRTGEGAYTPTGATGVVETRAYA